MGTAKPHLSPIFLYMQGGNPRLTEPKPNHKPNPYPNRNSGLGLLTVNWLTGP